MQPSVWALAVGLWVVGSDGQAWAAGVDRDTLLSEAPATPDPRTVRISQSSAVSSSSPDEGSDGPTLGLTAAVMWTPLEHLAGDVGGYYQDGVFGPSARVRFQFLNQDAHGVDMAAGLRIKVVGFNSHPDQDAPHELEGLLALGRREGRWRWMVNTVMGAELGDDPGRDAECKAFAGYNIQPTVRVGLDGRLQAEFVDETGPHVPSLNDMAFAAGPAIAWMALETLEVQALVGASKPLGDTATTGVAAQLVLALDL